jgi:hypothetical protein
MRRPKSCRTFPPKPRWNPTARGHGGGSRAIPNVAVPRRIDGGNRESGAGARAGLAEQLAPGSTVSMTQQKRSTRRTERRLEREQEATSRHSDFPDRRRRTGVRSELCSVCWFLKRLEQGFRITLLAPGFRAAPRPWHRSLTFSQMERNPVLSDYRAHRAGRIELGALVPTGGTGRIASSGRGGSPVSVTWAVCGSLECSRRSANAQREFSVSAH